MRQEGGPSVLLPARPVARANFVAFKPADFLAADTQHIPDGGFYLVRYYGWYSNKMRGQRARRAGANRNGDPPEPPSRTSAHWQRLIRRVYEADPLLCPDCGGAMRVISLVDSPMLIEGTLRGMGLWDPPPSPMPAITMRLLGATAPSRPSADAGTMKGMAIAPPAAAVRFKN